MDLVHTMQQLIEAFLIIHYCFYCALYILLLNFSFISLHNIFADHPVVPEMHNNPSPCDLTPQTVKHYNSSCCTETNNFTKLIKNWVSNCETKDFSDVTEGRTAFFFMLTHCGFCGQSKLKRSVGYKGKFGEILANHRFERLKLQSSILYIERVSLYQFPHYAPQIHSVNLKMEAVGPSKA